MKPRHGVVDGESGGCPSPDNLFEKFLRGEQEGSTKIKFLVDRPTQHAALTWGGADHGAGLRIDLENPERFAKSRDAGPYLGLVPKKEDSGESQPQLGIRKAGYAMVRRLLVGSAQYILRPFGPDTDLRRHGLRLCDRGGKNAKKRAAVSGGTEVGGVLHRLWVTGEVYEPLRHPERS